MSPLWIDVLEHSLKFLRQVVLGDVVDDRCSVPRADRHVALSLLMELESQKGTLSASLEAILLLITLWEKEKEAEDNRVPPQNSGAPLVAILRRYEKITNFGGQAKLSDGAPSSPTESFLRFLTLPDQDTSNVDLKQAAVVIISHLDRLAKPHLPAGSYTSKSSRQIQSQQVFTLGCLTTSTEHHSFNAELLQIPMVGIGLQYAATKLDVPTQILIKQIICLEKYFYILSGDGDVFSIDSEQNTELEPIKVKGFGTTPIVQLAGHCEGKHLLALNAEWQVYSWGFGEGGRLGHGDSLPKQQPTKIPTLADKEVRKIYCGSAYSACITQTGSLYTWGRGTYGSLGHGTSEDKLVPTIVQAMTDYSVIDVALGSGDSHTLCVIADGSVYAWGDGDCGKLGTGTCSGASLPTRIEGLSLITKVYSGSQFSVALAQDGSVYTWGKAHGGRLGHDIQTDFICTPQRIDALANGNKIVVSISVGSAHCLALTTNGEIYGWGRNDFHQICPATVSRDTIICIPILATPPSLQVTGMSCGSAHSILWFHSSMLRVAPRIPYVVDLTESTFKFIDQLLANVCGSATNSSEPRHPPSQESECIAVAALNLLRLQLHALIASNIDTQKCGLGEGSRLLNSLKIRILSLAGGPRTLKTMQDAAQWTLQVGWSVFLPTASERAQTLTSLLPSEPGVLTSGHRFMTDLLVGSLMAEEGLQTALRQAIYAEPEDCLSSDHNNLPLLHLIKQLLRNNSALTQARLAQLLIEPYTKTEDYYQHLPEPPSPSLELLHRFQRLLLSHIHQTKIDELGEAEILLGKYIHHIASLCLITLTKAHEVALHGKDGIIEILHADISDTLLYELLIGLVLLQRDKPTILSTFEWTKHFLPLLKILDNLNRFICDSDTQDLDDMGWPAIICRGAPKTIPSVEESSLIRHSDLENHVFDGGRWIIINGYVYDVQDYQ